MDLDYVMDSSDNEETSAIPASSQLTGSQWIARAHQAQLASDTASVQWQNSQTPIPALNALISQASKPVSRRPRKSFPDHHDLPPVPLFTDTGSTSRPTSASTSRKASTSAGRPRPRPARKSTGSVVPERTTALPEGPAGFLSMLKNVSEQVDSNAREKMRHKERQGDKDTRKSRRSLDSASIRPRRHGVRVDSRSSKAEETTKEVDFGFQSRENKDRQVELLDQTNLRLERHSSRYHGMSGPSFSRSATTSNVDMSTMDVDLPTLPPIDTSGDWSLSRAQPSAVSTSDGSLSASTSTTQTADSSRSQSAGVHGPSPSLIVHSGRSSTLTRTTSAPQARSTPCESSKADQSTSSAPSSQMSRTTSHLYPQTARVLSQDSKTPPPLPERSISYAPSPPAPASTLSPPSPVVPVQPAPLPLPRASQRPPPLGMRRVTGATNSGFTPSQTLPTRQRPFKPPLARPRVNPAVAPAPKDTDVVLPAKAMPGRLPTPRSSPPAPAISKQRRAPSPPPPAEADSSYGELSFDIDLLDAEMQKYD
ncbi:hypothetical protein DENSPDRAFT_845099 [Dentipellis sp. KUC8613]|nr:hypothetical protein DENSPDRAFT_845099 [Dentipellis sp. KUC8613]